MNTTQLALDAAEVREYRAMHALTAAALCAMLEINPSTLYRWENCAIPVPRVVLLWMRADQDKRRLDSRMIRLMSCVHTNVDLRQKIDDAIAYEKRPATAPHAA